MRGMSSSPEYRGRLILAGRSLVFTFSGVIFSCILQEFNSELPASISV
jgi:hypothetical protein